MHRSNWYRANMGFPTSKAEMLTKLGLSAGSAAFTQTYATAATTVPAITAGVGTGADASTPSGAEHTLLVNDVTANRKLLNKIIDILQAGGMAS